MQRDTPVQTPPLHRHRDDETPEEEEDHLVTVRFRHLHRRENPEHRKENQRKQGGRLKGDDARDPEQDHQDGHCRDGFGLGREDGGVDGNRQNHKEDEE
ncbi:hypothetical protein DSECCO2_641490 [anaerobic digester metagenome]